MLKIICERCKKEFVQEYQDEFDLCDECLDAMSFEE